MRLFFALMLLPAIVLAEYNNDRLPKDAFERVQVAAPYTIFDSVFTYSTRSSIFQVQTNATSSVTHLPNESSIDLDCWSSNSVAWVQSYQWFRYIPGKAQTYMATVELPHSSTNAGMVQRFGLLSDQNGIYYMRSNGVMYVGLRSYATGSQVDTVVAQSAWNIDKLDGTGRSGQTFYPTNGNIYAISFQWLGYGKVTWSIDLDGKLYPVHSVDHYGGSRPYISSATLPVRWEVANTDSGTLTNRLMATCVSVISSGSSSEDYERGFLNAGRNTVDVSINATPSCLIAIRPAQTVNGSGVTNRTTIVPLAYDVTSTASSQYDIQYGAVITGGSWFKPVDSSAVEVNTNGTLATAGRVLQSGFITAGAGTSARGDSSGSIVSRLPIALDNAGTNQSLGVSIIINTLTGNATARGSIQWRELR